MIAALALSVLQTVSFAAGPGCGNREGAAIEFARAHVQKTPEMFGLKPGDAPEFLRSRSIEDRLLGGYVYRVYFKRQRVRGVPVEYTGLEVIVGDSCQDLHVNNVGGKWIQGIAASPAPALGRAAARAKVVGAHLHYEHGRSGTVDLVLPDDAVDQGELVFYSREGFVAPPATYMLAYRFFISIAPNFDWYVDANSGEFITFFRSSGSNKE
ncbi:MAG: hypothetical protein HY059_22865 [Proteobacteria bacterium]|nr:hypothetical protein [Pseudomonadota bacterium]